MTFRESELSAMAFDQRFDAAIGRYVLCFQPDPVALVRKIASLVRPGGIILFHEPDRDQMRSVPPAPPMIGPVDGLAKPIFGAVSM